MQVEIETETFGARLRRLRLERAYTQAELAERARIVPSTVYRIEAGDSVPGPRTVRSLARALGLPPLVLTTGQAG
jgi:transcriptional regulator with XRE-family HTH domain